MPVLYVFVDKSSGEVYRQSDDGFFKTVEGNKQANEQLLQDLTCGDDAKFVMLNAYKILQPTYEYNVNDVFASSVNEPNVYCLQDAQYSLSSKCLTSENVSNADWFEQVVYSDDYL